MPSASRGSYLQDRSFLLFVRVATDMLAESGISQRHANANANAARGHPYKLVLSSPPAFIPPYQSQPKPPSILRFHSIPIQQRAMAPSNKCTLAIALLVAFAVVAPMLPPSAAARDGGAAKQAAPAPAPSASGDARMHPMGLIDDIIGMIPDLPLPRILPCPPEFPIKIPFIPCRNVSPPPVTECRSSLSKYMPACAGFLTSNGSSVPSPPRECCDAVEPFFSQDEGTRALCLCHVVNGDAAELFLPAALNHTRANSFLQQCGSISLTSEQVAEVCANRGHVLGIPPMDAEDPPSPPQRRH